MAGQRTRLASSFEGASDWVGAVDNDISRSTDAVPNPLLIDLTPEQVIDLTPEQVALLRIIAWPLRSGRATDEQGWPVWDGVRRRFEHDQRASEVKDALVQFGLPFPILDWAAAWETILGRLAGAFDSIRVSLISLEAQPISIS